MHEDMRQATTWLHPAGSAEVPAIEMRGLCKAFGTLQAADHPRTRGALGRALRSQPGRDRCATRAVRGNGQESSFNGHPETGRAQSDGGGTAG